jgi:molybdate transport system permease protein
VNPLAVPKVTPRRAAGANAGGGTQAQDVGVPRWLLVVAAVGGLFVVVPLVAMIARVNGAEFIPLITSESSLQALGLSLRTSLTATLLCLIFGVPLAVVLARTRFPGQRVVRALVLLPLVLPPVVAGIALLYTFGRRGPIGQLLSSWGIDIAFSTTAVVLSQTFVALPFLVLSLEGALRTFGGRYETVAATLGAGPTTTFLRVTLPLLLPAVVSGAVLSFARALGEFGATLTFAGSLAGTTRTLPLEIYLQRETDPDAAVALSLVLVLVAVLIVVASQWLAGLQPGARRAKLAGRPEDDPESNDDRAAGGNSPSLRGRRHKTAGRADAIDVGVPSDEDADVVPQRRRAGVGIDTAFRHDARDVEVSFEVRAGETVAVLGPNGSGKSTALGVIAGVLAPDAGSRIHSSRTLFDHGVNVPPHRRGVALLAQDALLFPHLSVLENVAFGPRSAGAPRRVARETAIRWLERVDAASLADRMPATLSGGQAQRIAIARALATDPEVLLLDEPMSALDVRVASDLRRLLRTVLADRTTVLVTHDVVNALTLADRALVMNGGRIVEQGSPRDLIERPRTPFMAQLAGLNFFEGERRGDVLHTDDGLRIPLPPRERAEPAVVPDSHRETADATEPAPARWVAVIPPALVGLTRPETLPMRSRVGDDAQLDSAARPVDEIPTGLDRRGEIVDTILDVEPHGDTVRVRTALVFADVPLRLWASLDVDAGDRVTFSLPTHDMVAFHAPRTRTDASAPDGTDPATPGVF